MSESKKEPEIWLMGVGGNDTRCETICSYLADTGYNVKRHEAADLKNGRPAGILLDVSPHSADGWGILLSLKNSQATREIPVLPIYLSEEGRIGGVFPVAGFFTLPIDTDYMMKKLIVLGLAEDAETYDLQVLVVSRKGEENVAGAISSLGFEVVNAYTGKEAVALATISRQYLAFCTIMLPDISAFELMEKLRLYPQTRNVPFFVLMKNTMKEGEKKAMARQVEHLVRKKELSREEFLAYLKRR